MVSEDFTDAEQRPEEVREWLCSLLFKGFHAGVTFSRFPRLLAHPSHSLRIPTIYPDTQTYFLSALITCAVFFLSLPLEGDSFSAADTVLFIFVFPARDQ